MPSRPILAATVLVLTSTQLAFGASPFAAIDSFGDSLSDVGNVYRATGGLQPVAPYFQGQFSNGPIWLQDLAALMGLPALAASLSGGSDYAWGGATTGAPATDNPSVPVPTLQEQIGQFSISNLVTASPSALYTISIGANDLFVILHEGLTGSSATAAVNAAAQIVATSALMLESEGARDLVLFDVPDLGKTPAILAAGPAAAVAASALSAAFNQQVLLDLTSAEAAGLKVFDLNTYALFDQITTDPGSFGFSNVTDPCYVGQFTGGGTVCSSPDAYLFWDDVHPTARANEMIAEIAHAALVPEPSTWVMMGIAFVGFAVLRARGQRRFGWREASNACQYTQK